MGWIASFFLKVFTGSTLSFVSNIVTALSNEHVAVVQAQTGLEATAVTGVIQAEISRQNAVSSIMQAEMQHRIWWWGWSLFVMPAGCYVALIHIKSLTCAFFDTACTWNIPEVPKQIEAWDTYVVLSFFGIFAASSVVTTIASKIFVPK